MEKHYTITSHGQSFIVKELLIGALYLLIGYLAFVYFYPNYIMLSTQIFVGGFIVYNIIPCFILQIQYNKISAGTSLIINRIDKRLIVEDKDSTLTLDYNEIASIKLRLCSALYRGGKRGMCAWELYHYAIITTADKKELIVTCLLMNDLRILFKESELAVIREKVLFPFIHSKTLREVLIRDEF